MENVRELVEALKKEGLEAYWLTMKSRNEGPYTESLWDNLWMKMKPPSF